MSLRQQNKARAKANILHAAESLIAEQGVEGTTTRDIAKLAGVSYQTLYNYFPSKGQVVEALMAEDMANWGQAVDVAIKHYNGDLLESLMAINRIALAHFTGPKLDLWKEVSAQVFRQEFSEEQFVAIKQIGHDRYHALLSMAKGMGQLDPAMDVHLMAHTIFCISDHALLSFIFSPHQDQETFLHTLNQQLTLLITPYLRDDGSVRNDVSVR